jgi:plastocyanin
VASWRDTGKGLILIRNGSKRLRWVLALGSALALFGGGVALAAHETIIGQPDNTYDKNGGTYTTDQGEVVPFQTNAGYTHNVTARTTGPDGKALFRSLTITGGSTGVQGTQYLTQGTYAFYCTIHPSTMFATLVVTGNGTPQARPQGDLSVHRRKISKVLKRGMLIEIDMNTKIDGVNLVARLGKTVIGRDNALALASGQQFDVVKLNKAGKSKLRSRSTAKVKVTAEIPFGSPASVKAKLK